MREFVGVMEWWSDGVMRKLIKLDFGIRLFPILQYSSTAIPLVMFTGRAIEIRPGSEDQLFDDHTNMVKGQL
jgi:hypothetical protein